MTPLTPEEDALVEAATTAYRGSDARGGLAFHPAWHDLDDDGRREAFERARASRRLEALVDPGGLSTTARAVLGRIAGRRA